MIGPVDSRPLSATGAPAAADWSAPALATTGVGGGGGTSTTTAALALPPSADVTVIEAGGGTPAGRPQVPIATPPLVDVRTTGEKPVPVTVNAGLPTLLLDAAMMARSPPGVKIALLIDTMSVIAWTAVVGGKSLMLLTRAEVGEAPGPSSTRPKYEPVVPDSTIVTGRLRPAAAWICWPVSEVAQTSTAVSAAPLVT